ncbi:Suppressor APC domain-containing protein 2 [Larimichthys crocea]|uniref:Suppressor APC domain-containing protein 2 n=1 Tax=Larimichthys crocea TaxID=215358 RepID=A0A6G0I185_LARCR|nr:Suppressor APC domain-containing protein 2 [Larimichthys crocea]
MALIAADQSCKLNGTYGRVGPRKEAFQGKTAKMQPKETEYSTDGLPKAFLHSLRTLFDILDDGRRGYVHISEIESRWQGADTRDLPGGVLGCLRRVTPPHGCLTFERFVAGLRYSMLNPENSSHFKAQAAVHPQQAAKQNQKPTCSVGTRVESKVRPLGLSNVTNTLQHRASSLQSRARPPEEGAGYPVCGPAPYSAGFERSGRSVERSSVAPGSGCYRADPGHANKPAQPQQSRVRSIESLALESPQLHGPSVVKSGLPRSQSESATGFIGGSRRHGRSREEQRRHTITNGVDYGMTLTDRLPSFFSLPPSLPLSSSSFSPPSPVALPPRPTAALMVVSRVGPRGLVEVEDSFGRPGPAWTAVWAAYTTVFIPLSSSLYSSKALHFFLWLKQMKELEQEKDSLLAGLEVVERARDWYQGQIHNVTERQRQVGQSSHCTDFFTEANQSRMNVLIPKLQEVNRCLNDLISCTGMSFPSSTAQTAALSANAQPPGPAPPQAIQRLKDQNRLLTQEVTERSERIAQLEQEKSALIKQLFEARARSAQDTSTMDSTFI